ncbi:hypothetical protein BV20DRAFT_32820 [Pilatotrama ljubarskyi]|nr:hypothetical protein BV20DRAFT_32820 [Pilatotrama ljubarskyi]
MGTRLPAPIVYIAISCEPSALPAIWVVDAAALAIMQAAGRMLVRLNYEYYSVSAPFGKAFSNGFLTSARLYMLDRQP